MPTKERNILAASNGDIMSMMKRNNTLLRKMYTKTGALKKAKINMDSGAVVLMNKEEIKETPVGSRHPISKNFRVIYVNKM